MTVTYWREQHSNPELSSESALATFNPIIKLAATPSLRPIQRQTEKASERTRKREREREISLQPWPASLPSSSSSLPNPEPFRRGKSCGPEFAFADFVFIGRVRASNPDYFYGAHFASLVIHYSGERPQLGTDRCRLFPDYGYIKYIEVRDRVKLPLANGKMGGD